MIRDPLAPAGADPYGALAPVGIMPRSTSHDVLDAAFDLMARGLMTPAVRAAWDELRFVERRLVVDFFMYPVDWPAELANLRADLAGSMAADDSPAIAMPDLADMPRRVRDLDLSPPDLLPLIEAGGLMSGCSQEPSS